MGIDEAAFLAKVKEKAAKAVGDREVAGPPEKEPDDAEGEPLGLSAGEQLRDALKADDPEAIEEAVLRIVNRN